MNENLNEDDDHDFVIYKDKNKLENISIEDLELSEENVINKEVFF